MSSIQSLLTDGNMPYVIGGGVVVATAVVIIFMRRSKDEKSHLVEAPKDTVVLRQIPRGPYAPNMSPFPLKLETYLRMAKIPYKSITGFKMSPKTKKTPWAQFNGEILTDSQLIIEHLNKYFKIDTMSDLSSFERAIARAFSKMIEENTYWCLVMWRWTLDATKFAPKVFKLPFFLSWMISRQIRKTIYGQGIGRFQPEEMFHIYRGDLKALSVYLGDKKFLMGEKACEVDCAIFGMLAQFKWNAPDSPLLKIMSEYPNLHAYCDRMKEAFWPDWDECITHGGTRKATK